jgi:hypothetical protein
LYLHWGGEAQVKSLSLALQAARGRWNDHSYATRICISQIVGEVWNQETGAGISVGDYCWPDYDFVFVVQWDQRIVHKTCANTKITLSSCTLEDFILTAADTHKKLIGA